MTRESAAAVRVAFGRPWRLVMSLLLVYTGTAMTATGATLLLVHRFGIGEQTGVTLALQVVPSVLLAPVAGRLIARGDPKRIAVVSSYATAVAVFFYPLASTPRAAQAVALCVGVCTLPGVPARMAMRADYVPEDQQHRVSGHIVAAERTALIVGPLLASLIVTQLGYRYVFYAEALLSVLASIPLVFGAHAVRREPSAAPFSWRELRRSYRDAGHLVVADRLVADYSLSAVVYCVTIGLRRLILPALLLRMYHRPDSGLGALIAALAAGGVLGGLLSGVRARYNYERVFVLLTVAEVIVWASLVREAHYAYLLVALAAAGLAEGATTALYFSRVQSRVPPADIALYFSLIASATDATVVVGVLLASTVAPGSLASWGPAAVAALILLSLLGCRSILRSAMTTTRRSN